MKEARYSFLLLGKIRWSDAKLIFKDLTEMGITSKARLIDYLRDIHVCMFQQISCFVQSHIPDEITQWLSGNLLHHGIKSCPAKPKMLAQHINRKIRIRYIIFQESVQTFYKLLIFLRLYGFAGYFRFCLLLPFRLFFRIYIHGHCLWMFCLHHPEFLCQIWLH